MTEVADHQLSPRNVWTTLGVFAIVMLLGGTEMTKIAVALPEIVEDLGLNPVQALWTADIYVFAVGVALIPATVLADRHGPKRLYLLGLGAAGASAAVTGATSNVEVMLLGRTGQGVGTAMLIAGTMALIRMTFPRVRIRAAGYGAWVASFGLGTASGPVISGGLTELAQWRWVFWINVPILAACLLVAWVVLSEPKRSPSASLDIPSALYIGGALILLIGGLKGLGWPESSQGIPVIAIIAGLLAVAVLLVKHSRLSRPFLDMNLAGNRLLITSTVVIAVTSGVFSGVLYLLAQQFQVVNGQSGLQAGITLTPLVIAGAVGGSLSLMLHPRLSAQHILVIGLVLTSLGLLLFSEVATENMAMTLLGLGAGIIMTFGVNTITSTTFEQRNTDTVISQECAVTLGSGIGIAVLGVTAIQFGTSSTGIPSIEAIYGPGAGTALGITTFLYTFFALTAGLIILSTIRSPTPPGHRQ